MSQKLFCLISVIFALALLVGCGPVTPLVIPTQTPTQTITIPQGYHDYVVDFSLSPDGRILVVGTTLHTIILNAESMTVIKTLPISDGISNFSLDGKALYLSGFNSRSLLLNTKNWEAGVPYNFDWYYLRYGAGIQVSSNGQTFAFASGGIPNECDGAHQAFEIHRLYSDEILFRQINCIGYSKIVYKYNKNGDRLFLGWEHGILGDNPFYLPTSSLLAILDAQSGKVLRKFELSEPVEFIEDDLGVVYLRDWGKSQFLMWDINSENYVGNSKTAKLKLDDYLFLTVSLDDDSYITNAESLSICSIGKMYGGKQESPYVFQFEQANGRFAYSDFDHGEIVYWDINNCRLVNTLKLADITSQ